ncbi:hypothetical protein ACF9IK_30395 [Kitasatospora hibisci]|uniref:hypothetical protein n=1 Tax=Kitasatospora hibisci TaxID=3369522 RepID=UPI0037545051
MARHESEAAGEPAAVQREWVQDVTADGGGSAFVVQDGTQHDHFMDSPDPDSDGFAEWVDRG